MEKLSIKEKAGYGIGEIASNIIWMTIMFFLPIFYTDTFGIPAAVVGTMFFVVRLFDAINDPIMGMIADRTQTRWGKYRPYILWMAIPYGIGGILMFVTPSFGLTGKIIYAYSTYIFMMVIYTAIMIPFSALSGVMTSDYLDRTSLNSYRFIGAFIGGLFIQGLALSMVSTFGVDNQSVISAHVQNQQLIVQETGVGTAKISLTARDEQGAEVTDEFLFKVNLPGENPPNVSQSIADTVLEQGFGTYQIDLAAVFQDKDQDVLRYRAKSSMTSVVNAAVEGTHLILSEQGIGTARISLTAEDGTGGVTSTAFMVRIMAKGNHAPVVIDTIRALAFKEKFPTGFDLAQTFGLFEQEEISIANVFDDPDGDELYYTATSSNPAVVAALVSDDYIVLKKKAAGSATIVLNADDGKGGISSQQFAVVINTPGNTPPVVEKGIDDVIIHAGFKQYMIDLAGSFSDREGESLTFKVTVNNSAKGYRITMSIFAVMCVFLFLITFATTRERVQPISRDKSRLIDDLKDLLHNRPWIILFVVSLVTLIYVAVRSAVIAYYFQYYVGDPGLTSAFLVSGSITIIISLTITKWLTKVFDKRLLYIICMIVVGGSITFYSVIGPDQIMLMFVLQIIQSFFSGPTMPLLWSMLADAADYNEWKTGRKAMGLAYSASTFAQKAGIALGGAIALWLLAWFDYQPNVEQPAHALYGMKLMMGIIPAMGAFACAVIIAFYNLDQQKMEQIQTELNVRKENP